jgi:hypothetical protein
VRSFCAVEHQALQDAERLDALTEQSFSAGELRG